MAPVGVFLQEVVLLGAAEDALSNRQRCPQTSKALSSRAEVTVTWGVGLVCFCLFKEVVFGVSCVFFCLKKLFLGAVFLGFLGVRGGFCRVFFNGGSF